MRNNEQPVSRPALAKPGSFFEAAVRNIRKYLLRRHLAHWHPISTAPNNQDLELRLVDRHRVMRLLFPCRRTNAGVWINADLGTSLQIEPIAWRRWQKVQATQAASSGTSTLGTSDRLRMRSSSRGSAKSESRRLKPRTLCGSTG